MSGRLIEDIRDFAGEDFLTALSGRTVLVTGATGLIGSSLIKSLVYISEKQDLGIKMIALIRDQAKADRIFKGTDLANVSFLTADMRDLNLPSDIRADYIIHCASITESKAFVNSPAKVITTSLNGTAKMLEFAKKTGVKGFVYLSTMEVYGNPGQGVRVSEDFSCSIDPSVVRNSYPLSKMMCENLCRCYASEFSLPVKVARLTQTFGPGVTASDSRLYAYFAKCAIEGSDIVLNTRGETERCYCYIADAVTGILTVLLKGGDGEFYNIATDGSYCSVADMAGRVAKEYGINVRYDLQGGKDKGFADTLYIDLNTDKLRSLGWKSQKISIVEMIDTAIVSIKEDML